LPGVSFDKKMLKPAKFLRNGRSLDHALKDHFKSHGMAASSASLKKGAIAFPMTVIIFYGMRVIRPIKGYRKTIKVNPVPFFGVLFGLLNFANHTRIHCLSTPFGLPKL
jgi:hypothetical protein